jgi:hypothetical protein
VSLLRNTPELCGLVTLFLELEASSQLNLPLAEKSAVSAGNAVEARGAAGVQLEMPNFGWFPWKWRLADLEFVATAPLEAKLIDQRVRDGGGRSVQDKRRVRRLRNAPLNKLSFRPVVRTSSAVRTEPGTGLPESY